MTFPNFQRTSPYVIIKDDLEYSIFLKSSLKKHISGLGGADCILCKTKQSDWSSIDRVKEGFPINRSAEDTLELYNSLVSEDGEILTKTGDFATRQGLTQQPLTTSNQSSITITHSYINVTSWFLKVIISVYYFDLSYKLILSYCLLYSIHTNSYFFSFHSYSTALMLDVFSGLRRPMQGETQSEKEKNKF